MRRKDKPPKGVGKPDLLSATGMEALDQLTRQVLTVSKEEIERRAVVFGASPCLNAVGFYAGVGASLFMGSARPDLSIGLTVGFKF